MIITELDRIVLIAIATGFLSGSYQVLIDYILKNKSERQLFNRKQFLAKFLYFSFSISIILGVMVFALSVWDTSMTAADFKRFTMAMAIFFAVMSLCDRLWYFIFSQFKRSQENTTND